MVTEATEHLATDLVLADYEGGYRAFCCKLIRGSDPCLPVSFTPYSFSFISLLFFTFVFMIFFALLQIVQAEVPHDGDGDGDDGGDGTDIPRSYKVGGTFSSVPPESSWGRQPRMSPNIPRASY